MLWWKKPAPTPGANEVGSLMAAQVRLVNRAAPLTIVDVGVQRGHTSKEYLDTFANCRVLGFEPDDANFAAASAMLAPYGERAELVKAALSASDGTSVLQVNSHDGTHSLLEIGDTRYWQSPAETVRRQPIATLTLDRFVADRGIGRIDILKMDIQGAELEALKGASGLLERGAIAVVALEVAFHEIYRSQPLFWDIAGHFRSLGYGFHGLFEAHYSPHNRTVLSWADAIFVSPGLMQMPA
jgi:FkbM family methyltransferase